MPVTPALSKLCIAIRQVSRQAIVAGDQYVPRLQAGEQARGVDGQSGQLFGIHLNIITAGFSKPESALQASNAMKPRGVFRRATEMIQANRTRARMNATVRPAGVRARFRAKVPSTT